MPFRLFCKKTKKEQLKCHWTLIRSISATIVENFVTVSNLQRNFNVGYSFLHFKWGLSIILYLNLVLEKNPNLPFFIFQIFFKWRNCSPLISNARVCLSENPQTQCPLCLSDFFHCFHNLFYLRMTIEFHHGNIDCNPFTLKYHHDVWNVSLTW